MRRLLAGAALALMPLLVPVCAPADTATTVAAAYTVPTTFTLPHFEQPAPRRSVPLRMLLYTLQALDAAQTSVALRKQGRYEQNPMVRPFAHGGLAMLTLGFALGDVARDRLLRRAPEQVRDSANAAQALSNVDGILTTQRALRAP